MWNSAHVMDMVNEAKNFGIETSGGKLDWKFLKESRDAYITRLNGIYERNLGNSGVQIIQGVSARAFVFLCILVKVRMRQNSRHRDCQCDIKQKRLGWLHELQYYIIPHISYTGTQGSYVQSIICI